MLLSVVPLSDVLSPPEITADSKNATPASVELDWLANNCLRILAAPVAYIFSYASSTGLIASYEVTVDLSVAASYLAL